MKNNFILVKKLKTKLVNVFENEDINEVLKFTKNNNYKFTGYSYVGGFAMFEYGKNFFYIQKKVGNFICSYDKSLIKID